MRRWLLCVQLQGLDGYNTADHPRRIEGGGGGGGTGFLSTPISMGGGGGSTDMWGGGGSEDGEAGAFFVSALPAIIPCPPEAVAVAPLSRSR